VPGTAVSQAFTEQIAELPAGARITHRLRRQVGAAVGDGQAVSVAGAGLMSWPIAHAAFTVHAEALLREPTAVTVLRIDETRRGRPRWTRCELTNTWLKLERFETNFVDLACPQGLLGQAAGRRKDNIIGWLDERGQDWKDKVQIVAMDPCATTLCGTPDGCSLPVSPLSCNSTPERSTPSTPSWRPNGRSGRSATRCWR